MPLVFTDQVANSSLFANASDFILDSFSNFNVTMNNHFYGISANGFQRNKILKSFYRVLSTNIDRDGVQFVSTIESFRFPIVGTQWHPEKNLFE